MPAKKKPGDSFRLPHRRHEYFNFFVPQPLGVVPMCESGRNILAKHKKEAGNKEVSCNPMNPAERMHLVSKVISTSFMNMTLKLPFILADQTEFKTVCMFALEGFFRLKLDSNNL